MNQRSKNKYFKSQILSEAASEKKSLELVDKILDLNKEIDSLQKKMRITKDSQLGILVSSTGEKQFSISFAIKFKGRIYDYEAIDPITYISIDLEDYFGQIQFQYPYERLPYGIIKFGEQRHAKYQNRNVKENNCAGSWVVKSVGKTQKGWGPLLYDLAIEWSTVYSKGLMSDREEVSPSAQNIWKNYEENRSDVKSTQLDINLSSLRYYNDIYLRQLTPDNTDDDCSQSMSIALSGEDWFKQPLSKKFEKEPVALEKLKNENILWIR